jgi:ribosomal protein S18 acetylase RimI-like enzyme
MLVIKKANPSHKNFIKLGEKSFVKSHGPDSYWKSSILEYFWREKCLNIYVAEYKGIPVAYVLLIWNNAWHLDTIYTRPGFRRRGIMKKLLKESFIRLGKKYLIEKVFASNITNDIASDKTLLTAGFVMTKEDPSLYNGRGGKNFETV